jgi:hypothetical protein
MILITVLTIITLLNILISAYMSYHTINIAIHKCKCAVMNAYWFIIFIYFAFSGIFLVYTLLVMFGYLRGYRLIYFIIGYVVVTIGFTVGSYNYTKYLTSKKCDCVTDDYKKVLKLITFVRMLMAVIMGVSLISWGIYLILKNSFMSKK